MKKNRETYRNNDVVLPADAITRQRIETDEKTSRWSYRMSTCEMTFRHFLFLSGTDCMCNNDVRATSVIYNPIWKYTAFKSKIISNLYSFSYPDYSSDSRIFTWHGEQSKLSSTLGVKKKKHVSQYILNDQKSENTAVFRVV